MECQVCCFQPVVQALSALLKTYTVSSSSKGLRNSNPRSKPEELNALRAKLTRELGKKKQKKPIINALRSAVKDFDTLLELVDELLPKLQTVCLECSRHSNDDNLSRSGQTFISVDAMASSGLASYSSDPAACVSLSDDYDSHSTQNDPYAAPDPNEDNPNDFYDDDIETKTAQHAHDYLTAHALPSDNYHDPDGCTHLPSHIEDMLRQTLKDFSALSAFERMLVLAQWSGMSFAEFGTMKWVPKELKHPQSKQLISQRWAKIVDKFPIASVLQKSKPCASPTNELSKHYSEEAYDQQQLDLDSAGAFAMFRKFKSAKPQPNSHQPRNPSLF